MRGVRRGPLRGREGPFVGSGCGPSGGPEGIVRGVGGGPLGENGRGHSGVLRAARGHSEAQRWPRPCSDRLALIG